MVLMSRALRKCGAGAEAQFHCQNSYQTASLPKCFPEESRGLNYIRTRFLHVEYWMIALESPAWLVS